MSDDILRAIANDGRAHLPPPLDEAARFIRRFVVVDEEATDFLALWALHTWAFEASLSTPYVRVVSAERASGKTRLLEVLALLVRRPWLAVSPSAATVYRKGDADAPTLLLDEIDNVSFGDKRDLLSVLNSGYRIGIKVPRCDDKGNLHEFDVYYPKCFSGIDDGKLPDTLYSRSVPVRLERRLPDEPIERFRHRHAEPAAEKITKRMAGWAAANLEALADAEPELPDELDDRAQEVWEPLLAVADLAGGGWPDRARRAAVKLAREKGETAESVGVELLADLRRVFQDRGDPKAVFSSDLVEGLNQIEEAGWGGWHDGGGIRARDVAHHLRRYVISPHKIRIGTETRQGYRREQFGESWKRYLSEKRNKQNTGTNRSVEPHDVPHSNAECSGVPDVPDVLGDEDSVRQDELDWEDGRDE